MSQEIRALDDPAHSRIPESFRLIVYRVVEEALNNALRHAQPRRVTIRLALRPDRLLHLSVEDDGRGFDPQTFQEGLGLRTAAVRVQQLGGVWQLTSAPGRGTTLTAILPLPTEPVQEGELA